MINPISVFLVALPNANLKPKPIVIAIAALSFSFFVSCLFSYSPSTSLSKKVNKFTNDVEKALPRYSDSYTTAVVVL